MAGGSKFWVSGGNGNTSSSSNWATVSGGPPGANPPTVSERAVFDGNSGNGTVNVDSALTTNVMTLANFAGSFTGSAALTVASLTIGVGVSWGFSGVLTVRGGTVTTNGKRLDNVNIDTLSSVSLGDDLYIAIPVNVVAGAFSTNGHSVFVG